MNEPVTTSAGRVLLATHSGLPESDEDGSPLPAALAELGIEARWVIWDQHDPADSKADLVVLRTTWDYTFRRGEFLCWCDSVPALSNPAPVVRWNTDKSYLAELTSAGLPVIPTAIVEPGGSVDFPEREFVVKPAVAAGSRGAARFSVGEHDSARRHLNEVHSDAVPALVQPYQPTVDREGETALVFFGGVFSHGFVKGPLLDAPTGVDVRGMEPGPHPVQPDAALRRVAEDVIDGTTHLLGIERRELLYARVDLVRDERGEPLLLELELTEPMLGFRFADSAAPLRFASAVRSTLARC